MKLTPAEMSLDLRIGSACKWGAGRRENSFGNKNSGYRRRIPGGQERRRSTTTRDGLKVRDVLGSRGPAGATPRSESMQGIVESQPISKGSRVGGSQSNMPRFCEMTRAQRALLRYLPGSPQATPGHWDEGLLRRIILRPLGDQEGFRWLEHGSRGGPRVWRFRSSPLQQSDGHSSRQPHRRRARPQPWLVDAWCSPSRRPSISTTTRVTYRSSMASASRGGTGTRSSGVSKTAPLSVSPRPRIRAATATSSTAIWWQRTSR